MWRRALALAGVAAALALAVPNGALALKAPTADAVKPRAFGSCVSLVELREGQPLARTRAGYR